MRAGRVAAAVAGALLLGRVAGAGVEGTHHDMRIYGLPPEKSVCSYCHVPHGAAADRSLLARQGEYVSELGVVGAFCYSCHDGTVVPTALVEAPDGTLGLEALTRSHGLRIDRLAEVTGGLEGRAHVEASGLVEPDPVTGALPERMECTACHDPHSDRYPPFLKAPLETLCQKCHSGADRRGAGRFTRVEDRGAANGAHPVGMPVAFSGKERKRPGQAVDEMVFNAVDERLRVPGLGAEERGDPSRHWSTGGHLAGFGADPATGRVMCSTCHSAHSVKENLLVIEAYDPVAGTDPLCAGCHGAPGAPQNPGGTPYYHPVQAEGVPPWETSTFPSRPLDIAIPPGWPVAQNGGLLCATCHRMHRGRPGSRCIRDNDEGKKYVCDVCHLPEEDVSGENAHHMTTAEDRSAFLEGRTLSWATGPGEPGDLSDGLTCIDCHVELAKSAHNW